MGGDGKKRLEFPYLIIIWFAVKMLLRVAVDPFLGFSCAPVRGFHLSAKLRVLRLEVLVSSCGKQDS